MTLIDWPLTLELIGVLSISFLGATLLPIPTEVVLLAFIAKQPQYALIGVLIATIGNTLGGITTYALGWLAQRQLSTPKIKQNIINALHKFGPVLLVFAWLPLVGDALCLSAGFLRIPFWQSCFWMTLGRGLRYIVIFKFAHIFIH